MPRQDDEFYRPQEGSAPPRRSITVSRRPLEAGEISSARGPRFEAGEDARVLALDSSEPDSRDLADLYPDLDSDLESPFLRSQRRIPVRRGPVNRTTARRLKLAVLGLALLALAVGAAGALYAYATTSWRFRVDSSDDLEILGANHVTPAQVRAVFGADIGRNIFFVPLAARQKQLEEIPWVESAAVMRLLPNRLRVQISERTPVAFLRVGQRVWLIDANGALMPMPQRGARDYSFPVIVGSTGNEPVSTLAARMKIFERLVRALDSGGAHYSQALSEVNLSDPEDVKATFADPGGAVLVHLGQGQFLERYKIYLAHVNQWRQQFPHLDSVDLRYDRQVIVNPDARADAGSPPPATPASRSARAGKRR